MVQIDGLRKRYGSAVAVNGVSLAVRAGELLTLLGPSGCGKTTTLRCIGGFVRPDAGTIAIGGEDVTGLPPYRRHFGMVFQSYALFPHLTVFENVAFGLRIRRVASSELTSRVRRSLESVRLSDLAERLPKQLSGGQQQRVALARALVYEPRVLLLDEPLSNLDAKLRVEMRLEIRAIQRQQGLTAIYVTHDQEEALSISDRVAVMREGRIEQLASPSELYHAPLTPFIATFVGTSNLLEGEAIGIRPVDGRAAVRVRGAFTLAAALPSTVRPGQPLWVVARPETIALTPAEQAAQAGHPIGKVVVATFLGAVLRVRVEVDPGIPILADIQNAGPRATYAEGDRVGVLFDPERLIILPRGARSDGEERDEP
jgi:putative spermidine/putrescine transport system ATP-binding protein